MRPGVPVRLLVQQALTARLRGDAWLSPAERQESLRFRVDKRRAEWRLGRWTAKHLVAAECGLPGTAEALCRIEVRAAADGAPEPFRDGRRLDLTLSISHSAGVAACVVATGGTLLGCDVELIRALRRATVAHHFTRTEQTLLDPLEPHDWAVRGTLLWTAKESALKALRQGLRLDTRDVEAAPALAGQARWRALAVTHVPEGRVFRGWWCRMGDHVLSIVADPGAALPEEADPASAAEEST